MIVLMSHRTIGVTRQQFMNLALLAWQLQNAVPAWVGSEHYGELNWGDAPNTASVPAEAHHSVKTTKLAQQSGAVIPSNLVGHGPWAGIRPRNHMETWGRYARRCFGENDGIQALLLDARHTPGTHVRRSTRDLGLARIAWLLQNGIPEGSVEELARWETPTTWSPPMSAIYNVAQWHPSFPE